ncbi:MAG: hypothetical protein HY842_02040 [Bacteroidetes bacterium]|nr:hypothetical protein [Bacteroidota bacterium]
MREIKAPLTNLQMEYLKLLSFNLGENDMQELRRLIAKFLNEKMQMEIDRVWEEKKYSTETINQWLNEY